MDLPWIGGYLVLVVSVGLIMGRRERGSRDYFVGNRQLPPWAVLGSLVATEVSAATYLAVPGVGFSENMTYLQFGMGSLLARVFVAVYFIPAFYKADCVSIYEVLARRFGRRSQATCSLYFLATRLLASGVRLMIAATGFSVILDLPFAACLVGFAALSLAYTFVGGIKAVVWTDCVQGLIFITAGLVAVAVLSTTVGGSTLIEMGREAGRWQVFNLSLQGGGWLQWINDPQWFITGILFGFLSTTAAMGTDHDLAQRLLCSKTPGKAKGSLILSGFVALPVAALFLTLGVCLYGFYQVNPDLEWPTKLVEGVAVVDGDKAFSHYMTLEIPTWLRGLLLMGVMAAAMSSLDSAMAALSSSAVVDLIKPWKGTALSETSLLRIGRWATVAFAVILVVLAFLLRGDSAFLWLAFKVSSLTYSSLLGLFFLALFSRRGRDTTNIAAMLAGTVVAIGFLWGSEAGWLPLAWTWVLPVGGLTTFLVGAAFAENRDDSAHD
jgi:SSS family solute:Na+ symporter